VNDKLERIRQETAMANFKVLFSIYLAGLMKTTKTQSEWLVSRPRIEHE
jgi:hypothetical protein